MTSWTAAASEVADLGPVLLVGRGHVQRQEVAERVDRGMQLGALLPLGAVVAGAAPAFGRGAERAAVEDGGTRLGGTPLGQAQHGAEVVRHGFEAARRQPAPRLVVDRVPGREVARQQAPQAAPARTIQRSAS